MNHNPTIRNITSQYFKKFGNFVHFCSFNLLLFTPAWSADVDTTASTVIINADEPQNRYLGNGILRISADADSVIELAKSSAVANTEFAMTGGTITIDAGVRIRNGGWNKGVWTANFSNIEVNGVLDLWDGLNVFGNALTGNGLIDIRGGTAWSGIKSLTVGNLNGSGTFSGSMATGDGARSIQIIKTGNGTQIFNNLANQRIPRFSANGGTLEFASSSNLTLNTSITTTDTTVSGHFTKSGNGSLTINGTFSPSGTTTVSGGSLVIFNRPATSSAIVLAANTRLGLHFTEVATVTSLSIAGSSALPQGLYNSSHPTYGAYFTGPGSLRVFSEPAGQTLGSQVLGLLDSSHTFNLAIGASAINYSVNLASQTYDIRLPSNYNATESYGLISFCNSGNNGGEPPAEFRDLLDKYRIIWLAGDNIGNSADVPFRRGVTLLGAMRMTQLYKIDPTRIYASGNSGGARVATGTAIIRDDFFKGYIGEVGAAPSFDLPEDFLGTGDDTGYFMGTESDALTSVRGALMTFYNAGNQSIEGDFREREISSVHHLFMTPNGNHSKLCKGPGGHTTKLNYVFDEALRFVHHPSYPVIQDDFANTNLATNPNPGDGFTVISGSPTEGNVPNAISGSPANSTCAIVPAGAEIRSNDVFNWNDSYGMTLTSGYRSTDINNANNQMEWRILSADPRETSEIRLTVQQVSATSKKATFILLETGMTPVTICTFDFDSTDEPIARTATDRAYFQDFGIYNALGFRFRGSDLTWHMDDDKFQFSFRQNINRTTFASPLAVKPLLQIDRWSVEGRWVDMGLSQNIARMKKVKQWRLGFKNSAIITTSAANNAAVDYVNVITGQQGLVAPQDGSQSQGNLFTQASDALGLLAFEAESFNRQDTNGVHHWIRSTTRSGFSGTSAVVPLSDYGLSFSEARFADYSSRLEYDVNFTKSGTHKVWLRGHAVSDDSCWISLDEFGAGAVEIDGFTPGSFKWRSKTIQVSHPGRKKISLWVGKDGLAVDQILFTSDLNYIPTTAATPSVRSNIDPLPTFTLTASATNGTLSLYPAGGVYESGQEVTVIAEPINGFGFVNWTGLPSNTPAITKVVMDGNKTITANFASLVPIYTLSATSPNGSLSFNPPGPTYPENTVVSVTVLPNSGNVFTGWTGDLAGMANPATITMNANKSITANIENPVLLKTNWVASASVGNGGAANAIDGVATTRWSTGANQTNGQWFMVDMRAAQIFNRIVLDGGTSANDYPRGYQVHVSNDGVNWGNPVATGVGSSGENTITFGLQTARYIRVTQTVNVSTTTWWSIHEFNVYRPAFLLSETSVNGAVTFNPPGPTFLAGTVVNVEAFPDSGYVFTGWSGGLSGGINPSTIAITGNTNVTANFITLAAYYVGDSDGDDLTNLLEYAFGSNPNSPTGSLAYTAGGAVVSAGKPVALNLASSGVDYRAVFTRRKDHIAAGLTYTVQFSAGLDVWVNNTVTPTVLTGAGGANPADVEAVSVPYPLSIPVPEGDKKPTFFRVVVTAP